MLKNIDPLLHPDLLHALAAMGHGDEIIICDANFPADSMAKYTTLEKVLRLDGVDAAGAVKAVLSIMPLDSFEEGAALRMQVVDAPDEIPPVQQDVQKEIDRAEGKSWPLESIERFAFYERAKNAWCILATGERRFYGCFVLRKGVIAPEKS